MAEIIGIFDLKTSLTNSSSLNGKRSSKEPPPRAIISTQGGLSLLLKYFMSLWDRHCKQIYFIRNIFIHLDRRCISKKKLPIYELNLDLFKKNIFTNDISLILNHLNKLYQKY